MKYSLGISNFLNDLSSFPFYCFPLFLCIDHLGDLSYLSLLFWSSALHSISKAFITYTFRIKFILFHMTCIPPCTLLLVYLYNQVMTTFIFPYCVPMFMAFFFSLPFLALQAWAWNALFFLFLKYQILYQLSHTGSPITL